MLDLLVIENFIDTALKEDIGFGDLTSNLIIPFNKRGSFFIEAREQIVVAGIQVAEGVFKRCAPESDMELFVTDGDKVAAKTRLARINGLANRLLTAERTALNVLQHLSGIATLTAKYVDLIDGTKAQLVDTRKTTPGLRALEKHATYVGGARNHRLRLDDGILIKDNHISICGGITQAINLVKGKAPLLTKIEVECDTLKQVEEALHGGVDMILLDNMNLTQLREAVSLVKGRIPLEASGGITLETIRAVAETGVDFISVGRISHSAPAVDIGLDAAVSIG